MPVQGMKRGPTPTVEGSVGSKAAARLLLNRFPLSALPGHRRASTHEPILIDAAMGGFGAF